MASKKEGKKRWYVPLIALGVLFVIGLVSHLLEDEKPARKESPQVVEKQESSQPQAVPAPQNFDPAVDLREAKKALEEKTKDSPYGDAGFAEVLLKRIPEGTKEYSEAQKLLKKVRELKQKQDAFIDKKLAEKESMDKKEIRKGYASIFENLLLEQGVDAYVTAEGKNATVLRVKWALMSRPIVHKLSSDDNLQMLGRMGFKEVIFTNTLTGQWWGWDLKKVAE